MASASLLAAGDSVGLVWQSSCTAMRKQFLKHILHYMSNGPSDESGMRKMASGGAGKYLSFFARPEKFSS
jgi:hypothetical protein